MNQNLRLYFKYMKRLNSFPVLRNQHCNKSWKNVLVKINLIYASDSQQY